MRILILGGGLMAQGAAFDYLKNPNLVSLVVADVSPAALANIEKRFNDRRLRTVVADANDQRGIAGLLSEADAVLCAIHYGFNVQFARLAIETKTHMVDLGGNNTVVAAQLGLADAARAAGVSIIPDCGLAPGMASILVAYGLQRYAWADSVHIRVGGLPLNPKGPLFYERLFSVEGLINEYVEVPVALRDGRIVECEPLADIETVKFDSPVGTLEAFNTSGGVSTLPQSFRSRVRNLDYKTLRYPGHAHAMRWLYHLGLFSSEPVSVAGAEIIPRQLTADSIARQVPLCERDRTIVRIEFTGREGESEKRHRLDIVDEYDAENDLTSMMRMTAFPAAIISQMQCRGEIAAHGVVPQELAVDAKAFVDELGKRNIEIAGLSNSGRG
jgi:lysine 6-dehydrogenase